MTNVVVLKRPRSAAPKTSAGITVTRPPTFNEIAEYARQMKLRARQMRGVQNNNPHAVHEDKSDMARAWEKLEDAIRKGRLLSLED